MENELNNENKTVYHVSTNAKNNSFSLPNLVGIKTRSATNGNLLKRSRGFDEDDAHSSAADPNTYQSSESRFNNLGGEGEMDTNAGNKRQAKDFKPPPGVENIKPLVIEIDKVAKEKYH
ncbi:hypothetical protein FQA39_LY00606 [Lamprigera yunnana]|nr:hypothetical protein FQA39_LY00606 [Lamprigera yunnana]